MIYLNLRYNLIGIVILDLIITIGSSVDLNMTVRDLRDILHFVALVEKF